MEDLKDNQMNRGLIQAFYKYLPETWIDFYQKQTRTSYTAFVKNWNSVALMEINEERLLKRINAQLEKYTQANGKIKGFEIPLKSENYDVLTPKRGINADIYSEISPLTFFCPICKKIYNYKDSGILNRINPNLRCRQNQCKGNIRQIKLVYVCTCGRADPVKPIPCHICKDFNSLKYGQDFSFVCEKHPNRKIQMMKKCLDCGQILWPKNALDIGNHIPFSLTLIDLVKSQREAFISTHEEGSTIIISYWLGKLDKKTLNELVQKGLKKESQEEREEKINTLIEKFINHVGNEEKARELAIISIDGDFSNEEVKEGVNFGKDNLYGPGKKNQNELALQVLEYETVFDSQEKSTLDDAIEVSKKLNTHARPEEYKVTLEKFGFKNAQVSGNIPFVISSFGYTRKETHPSKATLVGFPSETRRKKNVYATKLNTEGILFELDRKRIIDWLLVNKLVDKEKDNLPKNFNETNLKLWFFNQVDPSQITTFEEIDKEQNIITAHVYSLLHTMSHSLLRQAAQLCGLDKNSLSEYIFPNIPGFLIYCSNSQGFEIGALFNLFEAYLDKWLKTTLGSIERCIFDPICVDKDYACAGCIFLNEISCCHFNKDLDRRLLLGWYNKTNNERLYGFWEEVR